MQPKSRFWIGFAIVLVLLVAGFVLVSALIPTWGATPAETAMPLPGDERVSDPLILWNHAVTIQAAPEQIYPWLAQIGDTRGGFYSYTFIENLAMAASGAPDRYANAAAINPDWQNPPKGQGIILNFMAIDEARPDQYVLATATPEMAGVNWTWLWYLEPLDAHTTRLIVRHRAQFPPEAPAFLVKAVFDAGYVMERGMLLGIRERAEGRIPSAYAEIFAIILWLAVLAIGIAAAVRFVRYPGRWHPLGVGLEALMVLFIFTYIQPPFGVRLLLLLVLLGSLGIAYQPGKISGQVRTMLARERA